MRRVVLNDSVRRAKRLVPGVLDNARIDMDTYAERPRPRR